MATHREDSKKEWTSRSTVEDINSGSLQRIADAIEKMSVSYTAILNDARMWERACHRERDKNLTLKRILRQMKNKLK